MKQGSLLLRATLAAAFAGGLLSTAALAAEMDKSSPQLMEKSSSSSTQCFDSKGKAVADASFCKTEQCVDASGNAITDATVCSSSSSGDSSGMSDRDAASGMATGKRQHKPMTQ
ncbi:MAG: hypothetical protein GC201_11330 [Alphaproteobacteria bacterium]|nr:hypothetical protein [Alphaproteobacteria bacterium]